MLANDYPHNDVNTNEGLCPVFDEMQYRQIKQLQMLKGSFNDYREGIFHQELKNLK